MSDSYSGRMEDREVDRQEATEPLGAGFEQPFINTCQNDLISRILSQLGFCDKTKTLGAQRFALRLVGYISHKIGARRHT